jgi:predicted secreted protein
MYFIRLFLMVSLFLQSLCSAQQEISAERSIIAQTKDPTCKVMQWGKEGVSALVSPLGQCCMIEAYLIPNLGRIVREQSIVEKTSYAIPLEQLPQAMQDAVIAMNPTQKIDFRIIDGLDMGAFAQVRPPTIYIGKSMTLCSEMVQKYVIGHEITHIEKDHQSQMALCEPLIIGTLFLFVCAKVYLEYCRNKNKDSENSNWKKRMLQIIDIATSNPIIPFAIIMTWVSRLSQSCENEADFTAVTKLNCAQGAAEWAAYCVRKAQEGAANTSWHGYPMLLMDKISDIFGWTRHYSRTKALEYWLSFAGQQQR